MSLGINTRITDTREQPTPFSRGKTLYVGGSGDGNYTKIQEAINDSADGDTVFVYDDSSPYNENINVNKRIDLIGEDKDTTVIDGSYIVVYISADGVTVNGFTIRTGFFGMFIGSNYNIIINNTILNNSYGIWVPYFTDNNTIQGNSIKSNQNYGIYLYESSDNNITGNTISNNGRGLYLSSGSNNIVRGNNILNNGWGLFFSSVSNSTIQGNKLISNNDEGLHLSSSSNNMVLDNTISFSKYGISGSGNNNNIIKNNIIIYTTSHTGIWLQNSNHNKIFQNNISNCWGRGIDFYKCSYNNISWNIIVENGKGYVPGTVGPDGICLRVDSSNNIIRGNVINKNKKHGISLYSTSNYNMIIENYIEENCYDGVQSEGYYPSNNNIIYHNNFIRNNPNAFDNGLNIWDNDYPSGGNYWDDYTGSDSDGDGIGDTPYPIPGGNNEDKYPLMFPYDIPPEISNFQRIPRIQIPGGYVNISAQVTDNVELADVRLVIHYPDCHWENISILQNKTGDTYYCNKTYYMIGKYDCHIWAIDNRGNSATSLSLWFKITEEFICDAGGPYYGFVDEPIHFNGYVVGGAPPYSWHWDFGDGDTSDIQNPTHKYTNAGNYTVILYVTDSTDGPNSTVNDTTWALIEESVPPPEIYGPLRGKVGVEYDYNFLIPNVTYCDALRLRVDWGDTGPGRWHGPYEPGENVTLSYTWREKGDFKIRAQVMDVYGTESDWATLWVTMPRNRIATNNFIMRILEQFPILHILLSLIRV